VIGHGIWAAALLGQQHSQKTFRIVEGRDVVEIVMNIYPDQKKGPDDSSAEQEGWTVTCTYKAAPDTFLFQRTFPTEREARGAFDDLAKAAGEVEGLVRQEKFDEAADATAALMDKMKANSGETPILPTGQA
jgi:hypothetical protein